MHNYINDSKQFPKLELMASQAAANVRESINAFPKTENGNSGDTAPDYTYIQTQHHASPKHYIPFIQP